MDDYYVYIYLNPLKPSQFVYKEHIFRFQPIYVGIGRKSRYLAHIRKFKKKKYINPYFKNILRKIYQNNKEPIIIKLYIGLNWDNACKIEIEIIKHFGRKNIKTGILANMTTGGDGAILDIHSRTNKSVVSFDMNGDKLKEFISMEEAAKYYNCSSAAVGKCCRKKAYTALGMIFRYKEEIKNTKKINVSFLEKAKGKIGIRDTHIFQFDLYGNFIKKWDTITEAAKYYNVTESNMRYALKDNSKTITNFIWKYDNKPIESFSKIQIKTRLIYVTPIVQYDKNGSLIKEYESINQCSIETGIQIAFIKLVCDKKQQHKWFNRWFYRYDIVEKYKDVPKKINKLVTYNIKIKAVYDNKEKTFNSIKDASNFFGISIPTISRCINNKKWKPKCNVSFSRI